MSSTLTDSPPRGRLRPRSATFHVAALGLLSGLHLAMWLRGWIQRRIRFVLLLGFAATACAVAVVSLVSLTHIATSTRLLIDDAVTGLDSTARMRPLVVELQFEVLRQTYIPGQTLTMARVDDFERRFQAALVKYREAAFTPPDKAIGDEIERSTKTYVDALQPLVDNPFPSTEQLLAADAAMVQLTDEIAQGRQFNLGQLRITAEQARSEADAALEFSYWTWWVFGFVAAFAAVLVLAYHWIGAPDRSGAGDPGSETPWELNRSPGPPPAASRTPFAS